VLDELQAADAKRYRSAARRLVKMRKLAAGTSKSADVTTSSPSYERPTGAARDCNMSSIAPGSLDMHAVARRVTRPASERNSWCVRPERGRK
jgi:hypothetical protein